MANPSTRYQWRSGYTPNFKTKNGGANKQTFDAISDFIRKGGPQTQDALEAYAKTFTWHHQYSVNVPGGVEYVRWHIGHGNLVPTETE